MAFISFSKFAQKIGVSKASVSYGVKSGRLTVILNDNLERGLDEEQATLDWFEKADRGRMALTGSLKPKDQRPGGVRKPEKPKDPDDDESDSPTLNASKQLKEKYLAKTARLNYEERRGALVEAAQVKREAFELARMVRNAMMNIPDRISADLAAETNQFKIHKRLSDELRLALESLAEENKPAPVAEPDQAEEIPGESWAST